MNTKYPPKQLENFGSVVPGPFVSRLRSPVTQFLSLMAVAFSRVGLFFQSIIYFNGRFS